MTPEASRAALSASAPVFKRVYVWELPVRVYHWLNALCVLVLTVTGILIAHPPAFASATEASFSYWFGINRFIQSAGWSRLRACSQTAGSSRRTHAALMSE